MCLYAKKILTNSSIHCPQTKLDKILIQFSLRKGYQDKVHPCTLMPIYPLTADLTVESCCWNVFDLQVLYKERKCVCVWLHYSSSKQKKLLDISSENITTTISKNRKRKEGFNYSIIRSTSMSNNKSRECSAKGTT